MQEKYTPILHLIGKKQGQKLRKLAKEIVPIETTA